MPSSNLRSESQSTHNVESAQADVPTACLSSLSFAVTRFYTEFVKQLDAQQNTNGVANTSRRTHQQHRLQEKQVAPRKESEDEESAALRRLSRPQYDALRHLLWQWLLLLNATTRQHNDEIEGEVREDKEKKVEGARQQPSQLHANEPKTSRVPLSTPGEVERLFQLGLSSLIPSVTSCAGLRSPTVDVFAPWCDSVEQPPPRRLLSSPSPLLADSSLTRALTRLSKSGPLFSSWCALWFVCMTASALQVNSKTEKRSSAAPALVENVRAAWDAAVTAQFTKAANQGNSRDQSFMCTASSRNLLAQASKREGHIVSLDVEAVEHLWLEVLNSCAKGQLKSTEGNPHAIPEMIDNDPSTTSHAHPLFSVWASQWYFECCRVASHGRDDGFDMQAVPLSIITRVALHLCRRLEEEIEEEEIKLRGVRQTTTHHSQICSAIAPPFRSISTSLHDVSAQDTDNDNTCNSFVAKPRASQSAPLIVATLNGLALQTPAVAAPRFTTTTAANAPNRPAQHPRRLPRKRKRRRTRQDSDDDDDDDDDESYNNEDTDEQGIYNNVGANASFSNVHGGWTSDRRTEFQCFLANNEQPYEVAIAAGVLTRFALSRSATPPNASTQNDRTTLDGNNTNKRQGMSNESTEVARINSPNGVENCNEVCCPTVQLLREVYLRSGEVRWWTLGDSQRRRQLMTDKRL